MLSYIDPVQNAKVSLSSTNGSLMRVAITDPFGKFSFDKLPGGEYSVSALYDEGGRQLPIEPAKATIQVTEENTSLEFKVLGFGVAGKVVSSTQVGIAGVKIMIDGQQRGTTGAQGGYKLEDISPGKYTLEGVKEHYVFDAIDIEVQPGMKNLPSLIATDYHLCGKVNMSNDKQSFPARRQIKISDKKRPGGDRATSTESDGSFCFEVKSGTYSVFPVVSSEEKERGLRLLPAEKTVKVEGIPVLDVNFSQHKLSISGSIKCLDKCSDFKVQLLNRGKVVEELAVDAKANFEFKSVLPGKYLLKVANDDFCWKQDRLEVSLND